MGEAKMYDENFGLFFMEFFPHFFAIFCPKFEDWPLHNWEVYSIKNRPKTQLIFPNPPHALMRRSWPRQPLAYGANPLPDCSNKTAHKQEHRFAAAHRADPLATLGPFPVKIRPSRAFPGWTVKEVNPNLNWTTSRACLCTGFVGLSIPLPTSNFLLLVTFTCPLPSSKQQTQQ